jgi:hypothetical protein
MHSRRIIASAMTVVSVTLVGHCSHQNTSGTQTTRTTQATASQNPATRKVHGKVTCLDAANTSHFITPENVRIDGERAETQPSKQDGSADFTLVISSSVKRYTVTFNCGKAAYAQTGVSAVVGGGPFICTVKRSKCA